MTSYEVFSRIQPHEYLRRFLDQSIRPDGRPLDRFRKTLITTDSIATADASAMVRLGGTAIVCGIKAEVCEPHVERPDQGYLGVCIIITTAIDTFITHIRVLHSS